jgi:hypothetical protein
VRREPHHGEPAFQPRHRPEREHQLLLRRPCAGRQTGSANDQNDRLSGDILSQKETLELVRAYYRLSERPRRRLLDLAKALEGDGTDSVAS